MTMLTHPSVEFSPAAYDREAERLRHMAHRAARCRDLAPIGYRPDDYVRDLQRLADRLASKGH